MVTRESTGRNLKTEGYNAMIETRLLRYFLAIAREQNITKAAETLFVTQSTLSKQMMDLEKQLGKQLSLIHILWEKESLL